jgi:hypothetical protein
MLSSTVVIKENLPTSHFTLAAHHRGCELLLHTLDPPLIEISWQNGWTISERLEIDRENKTNSRKERYCENIIALVFGSFFSFDEMNT